MANDEHRIYGQDSIASLPSVVADKVQNENWASRFKGVSIVRNTRNVDATTESKTSVNLDALDREVFLVNQCLTDVELFISKLQACVTTYKERKEKVEMVLKKGKKSKKKKDLPIMKNTFGVMMPSLEEYTECFKLIKLAINLLTRLNGNIHNPNAVDSIHTLFQTLFVAVNSSRNSKTKTPDLARSITSPLLTQAAVEFLEIALDSTEKAFWRELGEAWTVPREDWHGEFVPTYIPKFKNGFTPSFHEFDESIFVSSHSAVANVYDKDSRAQSEYKATRREPSHALPSPEEVLPQTKGYTESSSIPTQSKPLKNQIQKWSTQESFSTRQQNNIAFSYQTRAFPEGQYKQKPFENRFHGTGYMTSFIDAEIQELDGTKGSPWRERQNNLIMAAYHAGHRVCQATVNKIGFSPKELSVQEGEYVAVLDGSRDWWLVRNCMGEEGVVSHKILREMLYSENHFDEFNMSPYVPPSRREAAERF